MIERVRCCVKSSYCTPGQTSGRYSAAESRLSTRQYRVTLIVRLDDECGIHSHLTSEAMFSCSSSSVSDMAPSTPGALSTRHVGNGQSVISSPSDSTPCKCRWRHPDMSTTRLDSSIHSRLASRSVPSLAATIACLYCVSHLLALPRHIRVLERCRECQAPWWS